MLTRADLAGDELRTNGQRLRLLGIFAHPDDETFCIGGTLAKYIAAGAEAMVVSFTRGDAGQIRDASLATRRTLGEQRARELDLACQTIGVQHVRCLDYGDGKLQNLPQAQLVSQAVAIIREFRPHLVFTFDETGAYGHPDHIAVYQAVTTACRVAGAPDQFPDHFQSGLLPHTPDRLYHCYFRPNARLLLNSLVRWLQTLDTPFRGSDDFVHALMIFADESTVLGFASDYLEVQWYPKGFYIIEQGEPATSLYLILSGSVDIFIEDAAGHARYIDTQGPGVFIGELGLMYDKPRSAHVVAREGTTCLVFSPGEPTTFAGRGKTGQFAVDSTPRLTDNQDPSACRIDVTAFVQRKVAALAQHRTQYPITPDMFPLAMLQELLGTEYFVQAYLPKIIETDLVPEGPVRARPELRECAAW